MLQSPRSWRDIHFDGCLVGQRRRRDARGRAPQPLRAICFRTITTGFSGNSFRFSGKLASNHRCERVCRRTTSSLTAAPPLRVRTPSLTACGVDALPTSRHDPGERPGAARASLRLPAWRSPEPTEGRCTGQRHHRRTDSGAPRETLPTACPIGAHKLAGGNDPYHDEPCRPRPSAVRCASRSAIARAEARGRAGASAAKVQPLA